MVENLSAFTSEEELVNKDKLNLSKAVAMLSISLLTAFFAIMFSLIEFRNNISLAMIILFIFFVLLIAINTVIIRRIYQSRYHAEFSNNMLISSLKLDTVFFLLYNNSGNIVYCDERYYNYFARKNYSTTTELEKIIASFHISGEGSQKIAKLIMRGKSKGNPDQEYKPLYLGPLNYGQEQFILTVLPLASPKEYTAVLVKKVDDALSTSIQMEQPHIGYYRLDDYGVIVDCNDYFAKILGYNLEELLGAEFTFQEIIDSDESMNSLIKNTKRIDALRGNWQGFLTLKSKYNEFLHTFILQKAEFKTNGEISKISGYVIKLQDPSLALKSKGVEKGWIDYSWKCFFENSPYPVTILDKSSKILRINQSFEGMLPVSYLGRKFEDIFEGHDHDLVQSETDAIANKGKVVKPLRALKVKGTNRLVDVYLGKILDLNGDTFGFMVRIADVTQQKELEENLSHAQRMQTIGQLTGSIAHDFNNLLTAINGFCDILLLKNSIGDPSYAYLVQIKQSAERASNLVGRLLAFSRKQTMKMQMVNLKEFLSDLSVLVQRLVGADIKFHQEINTDTWLVKIDPVQMEQVILNLAVNASHAMQLGGSLLISAKNKVLKNNDEFLRNLSRPPGENLPPAGQYVCIEVADSGSGIAPDIIQRIFEPFFTTKSEKLGTGLGLSTVFGIVSQSEGYIFVKSKIDYGTTFYIYLPRYTPTHNEISEAGKENSDKISDVSADFTGTGVIALVEDEEAVRVFAKSVLVSKGYEVLEFESAKKALATIENDLHRVDLIISDVMMPEMTGPAFVTEVQKTHPHIKVIFISGYGEDAFTEEYGSKRDFHFLPKPFSLKALVAKVKEVIG
jgi:two-component system cell cycle sensor histidine kinase/response regulator CckA